MHKNSCPLHPCTPHALHLICTLCNPHSLCLPYTLQPPYPVPLTPHILYLHPLDCVPWIPHILHPVPLTPCNLHLIPYTLHPCPALCTLHPFAYWKMIGFPLTPFQILNSIQSWNCKLSLLIIKVPKAPFPHVFKSSALPKLMTKLTLNEPAITENRKVKSMDYITSVFIAICNHEWKTGRLFNLKSLMFNEGVMLGHCFRGSCESWAWKIFVRTQFEIPLLVEWRRFRFNETIETT